MPALLLFLVRFVRLLLSGHQAVAIENAALRLQLAAFRRKRKRPVLTAFDRLFWVGLSRVWRGWRGPLHYVQADTVVRWERERFRRFWARVSRVDHRRPGRPATVIEVRRLIERMVAANPLWRAPRLHGELQMLGIQISERTVWRILHRLPRPPTQTWKTFLHNHLGQMVSIDFFTVPTVTLRVLFVFVVLETSAPAGAAFQCDRAPHRSLDGSTDRRGLRRSRCAPLSHSRSGSGVRRRGPRANCIQASGAYLIEMLYSRPL
jgi:hypothetical protein